MYLLIEHSGTVEHLKIAEDIQDFAENQYGCSCETVVGDQNEINLYNDSLSKFASFNNSPTDEDLSWYLGLSLETEE